MTTSTALPTIDVDSAVRTDDVLLDVRERPEWTAGHAPTALHIPMSELTERVGELPRGRRIVCMCRSGNRSAQVTAWLRAQGVDAVNMAGGMQEWAVRCHPVVDQAGHPGVVV